MRKIIVLAVLLCLMAFASPALAVSRYGDIIVDGNRQSPAISNLTCAYERGCFVLTWDHGSSNAGTDFNNYHVNLTSSYTTLNVDFNTNERSHTFCSMPPGNWAKATVWRYDSNNWGVPDSIYYMNVAPDQNCTIDIGSPLQAGEYLVYSTLVGIGSIVVIIVFAIVAILLFGKMHLKLWK